MTNRFSGCEIVQMGIQIENNGQELFSIMEAKAKSSRVKEVFRALADDSAGHASLLAEVFGNVCRYDPEERYPDEYFAYMKYLAGSYMFLKKEDVESIAGKTRTDGDAISIGVQFIKDTILFYEGMEKVVNDADRDMVKRLIIEEKKHLGALCDLKNSITGEGDHCGL